MHARSLTFSLLAAAAVVAGCNGGGGGTSSRRASSTSPVNSSATGKPSSGSIIPINTASTGQTQTASLAVESVAQVGSQAEQLIKPGPIVGLAFRAAPSGGRVDLKRLEVASSGTIDERVLGEALLYEDKNGNAEVDTSDVLLARAARAATNDAAYVFTGMTAAVSSRAQFLVAVDTAPVPSNAMVAYVGSTVALAIAGNTALQVDDAQGRAVTPTGTFPLSASVVLEVNDTVLISELSAGPGSIGTAQDFIELFNATGKAVDLSNYYLTDFTENALNGKWYWKLPSGQDFGPSGTTNATLANSNDFYVRFPAGTMLPSGKALVVAVDAGGFKARFGRDADFMMRNAGAVTTTARQMLTWNGTVGAGMAWAATPVHANVGLTGPTTSRAGQGEPCFLVYWDGQSDLIKDVDLVHYGTPSSLANFCVDKSPGQRAPGAPDVRVDSAFDNDATTSTFQPETPDFRQNDLRAPMHQSGTSLGRIDFTEGREKKSGGNGLTGNDETSENAGDGAGGAGTFDVLAVPTPGIP